MTKWLWLFLAFYILVWQPALLGRMLNNNSLYELSLLNAGVFFIGWIISALCKPSPIKLSEDSIELKRSLNFSSTKKENNKLEIKERLGTENIKDEEGETENIVNNNINDEEKTTDKPLKESINIPKIVQPITWHPSKKKKKKTEIKWGQRLILLITLCLAAIIAWTLWEFLWSRWIAISLLLWWILYLIIGKLFDVNWFYNARKLFTNRLYVLLIIAWIVYWAQSTQESSLMTDFSEKISSYIKGQFSDKNNSDADTWSVIYVFEWTGEVISDTWTDIDNSLNITWTVENQTGLIIENETWTVNSWVEEKAQPVVTDTKKENNTEEKTTTETESTQDLTKRVTIWEAVKSILAWANLSTKTNVAFKFVSKSNELYPYFKTAQEKQMIWTDTNPNNLISCETYITMKWLREWRNVGSYTSSTVKSVYWNKATELWKLNWCKKWTYLTRANL